MQNNPPKPSGKCFEETKVWGARHPPDIPDCPKS